MKLLETIGFQSFIWRVGLIEFCFPKLLNLIDNIHFVYQCSFRYRNFLRKLFTRYFSQRLQNVICDSCNDKTDNNMRLTTYDLVAWLIAKQITTYELRSVTSAGPGHKLGKHGLPSATVINLLAATKLPKETLAKWSWY